MKTEYDALDKSINASKQKMDELTKKGESLTDKKEIAANKKAVRSVKGEYDVAKAR